MKRAEVGGGRGYGFVAVALLTLSLQDPTHLRTHRLVDHGHERERPGPLSPPSMSTHLVSPHEPKALLIIDVLQSASLSISRWRRYRPHYTIQSAPHRPQTRYTSSVSRTSRRVLCMFSACSDAGRRTGLSALGVGAVLSRDHPIKGRRYTSSGQPESKPCHPNPTLLDGGEEDPGSFATVDRVYND